MTFPRTRHQVLHEFQIELEDWVMQADIEEIKDYLTSLHGCIYPDDWRDFLHSHLMLGSAGHYIQSCEYCQEIVLAILTISETDRPELKNLFYGE